MVSAFCSWRSQPIPAAAQGVLPASFAGWNASASASTIPPGGLDSLLGPDTAAFQRIYRQIRRAALLCAGAADRGNHRYTSFAIPAQPTARYTFLRTLALRGAPLGSYASGFQGSRADCRGRNAARHFSCGRTSAPIRRGPENSGRRAGQEGGPHAVSFHRRAFA